MLPRLLTVTLEKASRVRVHIHDHSGAYWKAGLALDYVAFRRQDTLHEDGAHAFLERVCLEVEQRQSVLAAQVTLPPIPDEVWNGLDAQVEHRRSADHRATTPPPPNEQPDRRGVGLPGCISQ